MLIYSKEINTEDDNAINGQTDNAEKCRLLAILLCLSNGLTLEISNH